MNLNEITTLKLEIGWTWIIQKYQGAKVNCDCKLLLLTYCFEVLKSRRVQIKMDLNNLRSRNVAYYRQQVR
jgi:RimJ/RimL family protein N-acetyltransferase